MIAVINRKHEVVWGFGTTVAAAMTDAHKWIAIWKAANPSGVVGDLDYAQLAPDADLTGDGESLWEWVQESVPVQDGLF